MNSTPQTFPYETKEEGADAGLIFPKGTVTTVLGQVRRIDLGWAGSVRCRLQTSIGEMTLLGNRETLCLDREPDDWLRVRVMRRHRDEPALHVMKSIQTMPASRTAWVPTSLHHREAHMRRLRTVLDRLEPAMQALFMVAMCDAVLQRRFFWRVGAADHHCYPGGLFDQSVRAAELAHAMDYPSMQERSLATLSALLFDLGEAGDERLTDDRVRRQAGLRPHSMTARCLERAMCAVEVMQPKLPNELRNVLAAPQAACVTTATVRLARQVHEAVLQSWSEGSLHAR